MPTAPAGPLASSSAATAARKADRRFWSIGWANDNNKFFSSSVKASGMFGWLRAWGPPLMTTCERRPQEADLVSALTKLTASRAAMMFGLLGVAGGTMAMTRDGANTNRDSYSGVDSIGANSPPDSQKAKVDKRAFRTAGAKGPPAPSRWIRSLSDYDRRERCEYAVTRYG